MSMNMFTVELSPAQYRLAREVIAKRSSCGDCRQVGAYKVEFQDYEGFAAFRGDVFKLGGGSTRNYISANCIIDKLDAGFRVATGRA